MHIFNHSYCDKIWAIFGLWLEVKNQTDQRTQTRTQNQPLGHLSWSWSKQLKVPFLSDHPLGKGSESTKLKKPIYQINSRASNHVRNLSENCTILSWCKDPLCYGVVFFTRQFLCFTYPLSNKIQIYHCVHIWGHYKNFIACNYYQLRRHQTIAPYFAKTN